ncbi:MAG TPA: Spy/CpxP family protein refolding chaperone [Burkholderiales bacterium]|nr:Spy/CpxP family protein refolding chaperone [Burkholderiales bacterium]
MRITHRLLIAAAAAAVMAASAGAYAQAFGPCGGPGFGSGHGAGYGPGFGPGMGGPRAGYGPGPGAAWGGPRGAGPAAGPVANSELRLAYLKNELKLTAGQDAAWSAYESAVKAQAASMLAHRNAMFTADQTTDRAALHAAHLNQRAAELEALSTALNNLYAVLTPEQKTIAEANMGGRFFAMGPRGWGRAR